MSFGPLDEPFFSGTASSADDSAPSLYPVALGGQGFVIDLKEYDRSTVDVLRQQADQSDEPGEQSLNPQGLWRRSQESWHMGAGQRFLDAKESDRNRFRSSKGMDPWTRGQLSLLADTELKSGSASTDIYTIGVQGYLYIAQGTALKYSTDPANNVATVVVTGTPGTNITSITTNGERIWLATGADIYSTTRGAATAAVFSTQDASLVGYANGRLLAANNETLYEISNAGVATSIFVHPNSSFRWSFIESGQSAIYVGGNAGEQGEIYRIALAQGTTGLGAPTSAVAWPDGEQVLALRSYVGGVIIGTNRGVRVAAPSSDGSLNYGPVIRTTSPVRCLEGQDQFVWFGWSNYDGTSTGLGRLDLTVFTADLTPAWATDLMATTQGNILSVTSFGDRRYFTVSGVGTYGEKGTKVASGTLDTGEMRYGTTERKVAVALDLRYAPLAGAIQSFVSTDGTAFAEITTDTTVGATGPDSPHSMRYTYCERLELRFVLTRDATVTTTGPTLLRWTTKVSIAPARTEEILVPILLYSRVEYGRGEGSYIPQDVPALWEALKTMEREGRPVLYQEGQQGWLVTVSKIRFKPTEWLEQNAWLEGTAFVLLQTLE